MARIQYIYTIDKPIRSSVEQVLLFRVMLHQFDMGENPTVQRRGQDNYILYVDTGCLDLYAEYGSLLIISKTQESRCIKL